MDCEAGEARGPQQKEVQKQATRSALRMLLYTLLAMALVAVLYFNRSVRSLYFDMRPPLADRWSETQGGVTYAYDFREDGTYSVRQPIRSGAVGTTLDLYMRGEWTLRENRLETHTVWRLGMPDTEPRLIRYYEVLELSDERLRLRNLKTGLHHTLTRQQD